MNPKDTKTRILDAAEDCFAEHGFQATSLRTIIAAAGVNLAAVHYHFGSRAGLLEAVFARRVQPLNEERLKLLDAVERQAKGKRLPVRGVLEAFLTPALRLAREQDQGGRAAMRLFGRIIAEPGNEVQILLQGQFREVFERFMQAFAQALPGLPREVLCWRMHFVIGSMAHLLCMGPLIRQISHGLCDASDTGEVLKQLVQFLEGGMQTGAK